MELMRKMKEMRNKLLIVNLKKASFFNSKLYDIFSLSKFFHSKYCRRFLDFFSHFKIFM